MRGEGWGGVENPDTSLVRRLKHSCQYRNTKSKKRRNSQTKTNKKESGQNKSKTKGGEGESVEKPDTSLARQFKHLNRKQEEQSTRQENQQTAQIQRYPMRGGGKVQKGGRAGQEKLEALTVFSQKIQARRQRGDQRGSRREQSSKKLGSNQYRERRSQAHEGSGCKLWYGRNKLVRTIYSPITRGVCFIYPLLR